MMVVILVVVSPLERTVAQNVIVCVAYKGYRTKGVCKLEGSLVVVLWGDLCLRPQRPKEKVIGTVGRVSR